ncbi:MAG TPA: aromatic ring-hydroxylating dioxygenase subunit alpha [Polyangium sp.]|nr:aromatic ring-hydroxylating dioxygenase subunit alpha [Polyangium sp.]
MFESFANVWTPVITAKELRKKPLSVKVAGETIALFRDGKGGVGALLDRCPHRGVALSLGQVDADGCLACPFHGWSFQKDGACAKIPLNTVAPEKRARYGATAVPVREIGGLVWIFTGPDPAGTEPEPPPALVEPGWHVGYTQELWKTHWTRAMENMLDTPHLPYIHRKSIGKDARKKLRPDTTLEMRIEPAPFGGLVYAKWDYEAEEKQILKWRKPNAMELHIMDEPKRRMCIQVYCIPVDEAHTKMMLISARTFLGAELITWFATKFNNILGEDREVLETSNPPEVPPPGEEPSVATDAPTLFFRKYYFRELRSSTTTLVPTGRLVRRPDAPQPEAEEASMPNGAAVVH